MLQNRVRPQLFLTIKCVYVGNTAENPRTLYCCQCHPQSLNDLSPCKIVIMKRSVSRASKISSDHQDLLENFFPGIPDIKWQEFLEKEETDFFILGLREEIFHKSMDICYENYLEKQAVAFTVHCAHLALCKVLNMYCMFRDPGDTDDAKVKESWEPDPEPEPSVIDSWGSECIVPLNICHQTVKKGRKLSKPSPKPTITYEEESLESCSFMSDLFDAGEDFYNPSFIPLSSSSVKTQKLSIFTRTLSMSRSSLPLIMPIDMLKHEFDNKDNCKKG